MAKHFLADFKKISSSDKKTTLKHKDGHFMVIAHAKLNGDMRKALDGLAMVKSEPEDANPKLQQSAMAKGGEVEVREEEARAGGKSTIGPPPPETIQVREEDIAPDSGLHASQDNRPNFDVGGYVPPAGGIKEIDMNQQPEAPLQVEQVDPAAAESQAPVPAQPAQTAPPVPQQDMVPTPPQTAAASPQSQPQGPGSYAHGEAQKWAQDLINQHITPETYSDLYAKKDTLGKIGTMFGLMISGAGAGLSHQPNALLKMMDNEINNDLAAQTTSKANAQNFLRIQQQGHLNKANIKLTEAQAKAADAEANIKTWTGAKMMMDVSAFHKLVEDTKKIPPQLANGQPNPARQQAEAILGVMGQGLDANHADLRDKADAMGAMVSAYGPQGGGQDPESQFQASNRVLRLSGNKELAEDKEGRHFPGMSGQASKELDASDREKLDSGIIFDQKLKRFMDWTSHHSGDLNPADRYAGEAMAAELQGAYRQATHGGVYKEGEQNFISKLIDSTPTKFFNSVRVMPQLKALAHEHQSRMSQTAKNLGFPGYKTPSEPGESGGGQGAAPSEGTSKSGRPIVMRDGKWYYK